MMFTAMVQLVASLQVQFQCCIEMMRNYWLF